jgi:hypothetical protein
MISIDKYSVNILTVCMKIIEWLGAKQSCHDGESDMETSKGRQPKKEHKRPIRALMRWALRDGPGAKWGIPRKQLESSAEINFLRLVI